MSELDRVLRDLRIARATLRATDALLARHRVLEDDELAVVRGGLDMNDFDSRR